MNTYRTQKAQGISLLESNFKTEMYHATANLRGYDLRAQPFLVLQPEILPNGSAKMTDSDREQLRQLVQDALDRKGWALPLFARPCPTTPRHGFVDSRLVENFGELATVIEQTLAADPQGEIVLMPLIPADYSAVVTSAGIGVGPGNDGATAGVGATNYQIASQAPRPEQLAEARIAATEDAYFEVVCSGEAMRLVQMRGGPKLGAATGNFVPTTAYVFTVLKAEGDALEWEAKMKENAGRTDVVVWHPGGWRGSHYAVHAILNRVPVVFDETCPPRHSTIAATDESLPPYDADAVAAGVARGLAADLSRFARERSCNLLSFAAVCTHGAPSMRTGAAAEMMGAGLAVLYRLASAACVGEYRHKKASGLSGDRNRVYADTLERFGATSRKRFARALTSFANDKWSSSFGGVAWARCAMMTADLEQALVALLKNSDGRPDIEMAVARAHRLLNAAHNTGALLNKFGSPSILDIAATGSRWAALAAVMFWHRGNVVASTPRIITTVREAFGIDEVAAQARKFWSTERGEFLDLNEAIERALTTKTGKRRKIAGEVLIQDVPPLVAQFLPYGDHSVVVQIARSDASDRVIKRPARVKLPKNVYGSVDANGNTTREAQAASRPYMKRIVNFSGNASALSLRSKLGARRSFAGTDKLYKVAEVVEIGADRYVVRVVVNDLNGGEGRFDLLTFSGSEVPSAN